MGERSQQPIRFGAYQQSGYSSLSGASPVAMNVVMDKAKTVRRRPGIAAAPGVYSGVVAAAGLSGIYRDVDGAIWAVSDELAATVYLIGGGVVTKGAFNSPTRPVFAETGALVAIAAGDAPYKVIKADGTFSALANAPLCTHIAANSIRLVANDSAYPEQLKFSGFAQGSAYAGHEEWLGGDAGFVTAEARPGDVVGIAENTSEIFVWKANHMTLFAPDATYVYVPVVTTEYGLLAPYSVIRRDQAFLWLDHRRRIVVSDGRSSEVISDDIQATLDEMSTINDCYGYRVKMEGIDCFVWTFPSDGRTFVWQDGGWSQWSGWMRGNWAQFMATCHAHDPSNNVNYVGTNEGLVGALSFDASTDFGDPVQAYVETGYENRGTDNRKQCVSVRLSMRRGHVVGATAPVAWLKFRDSSEAPWIQIPVSLGASGDREIVVELRSLGTYRRRQWAFHFTGTVELVLVSAVEEFEILEN